VPGKRRSANYLAGPGRPEPESGTTRSDPLSDLHLRAAQGRPDAIEALLRQFRLAIVRYCRARLAQNRLAQNRLAQTGSQDEDDPAPGADPAPRTRCP